MCKTRARAHTQPDHRREQCVRDEGKTEFSSHDENKALNLVRKWAWKGGRREESKKVVGAMLKSAQSFKGMLSNSQSGW